MSPAPLTPTLPSARTAIGDWARSQLGETDAAKYWAIVLPGSPKRDYPRSWCGAFGMACVNVACSKSHRWGAKGTGFRFTPRDITTDPQPGDIAYFHKPYQHHALVIRVEGDVVHTIDGNVRGTADEELPGVPAVRERSYRRSQVTHFYSIARFIDEPKAG